MVLAEELPGLFGLDVVPSRNFSNFELEDLVAILDDEALPVVAAAAAVVVDVVVVAELSRGLDLEQSVVLPISLFSLLEAEFEYWIQHQQRLLVYSLLVVEVDVDLAVVASYWVEGGQDDF